MSESNEPAKHEQPLVSFKHSLNPLLALILLLMILTSVLLHHQLD